MIDIAVVVKSHQQDLTFAKRLLSSLSRYNSDSIPVFVVVPESDISNFRPLCSSGETLLRDEDFAQHLVNESFGGMTTGYVNQQIIKLTCWEQIKAQNFLVLDSDVEIIREFKSDEFLADDGHPYSVLTQDKDLLADPHYFASQWRSREHWLDVIANDVSYSGPWPVRTCHGNTVLSSVVLQSLRDDLMKPRAWSYEDLLRRAPYEFTWYSLWLQVSGVIPVRPCEPWVKTYHSEEEHLASLARGQTLEDVRRAYMAICINSNFARHKGLPPAGDGKPEFLARYLSYGEYLQTGAAKVKDTWSRRLGAGQS